MQTIRRTIFAFIILMALVLAAAPAAGQWNNGAVGYGGGFANFGALTDGDEDLALDAGWIATVQAERWYGSRRVGLRLAGGYTERPFGVDAAARDVSTWTVDGSLMLRMLPASETKRVAPFFGLGAGMIHYGLGADTIITSDGSTYPGDGENRLTVVGSFGFDILPAGFELFATPIGLRLEASDHVALESPFEDPEGEAFGPVHNFRVTLSMLGLFHTL